MFELLKKKVSKAFFEENSASDSDISKWKGQDIVCFQEDLQNRVKASISEKSFYSYFKKSPQKLPRIDILNLLSQYCGYQNWNDFKAIHHTSLKTNEKGGFPKWLIILLMTCGLIAGIYFATPKHNTFSFCFIDQDRNQPLTQTTVDIIILNDEESPFHLKSDSLGCFSWQTKDDYIRFVIHSPYYKSDTIYRSVRSFRTENIPMQTDDYALMLHYYANQKIENWKQRRNELSGIIADNAVILQVLPYGIGVEVYSKEKFINMLTTPTKSLKNIEIIASKKRNGQVVKLKFKVKS